MPDIDKILRLVAEGALSADEAEEILAVLAGEMSDEPPETAPTRGPERPRYLRIEISEKGRQVVNLRMPINIASFAAGILPGLPDDQAERIRSSVRAGERGTIVDITDQDGDRVLIVSE